ncbi:hypothetical protein [Teredinibacter purpureus]|jgi:hypothetical protein|uniref:hypothetical protein n=1 Tax=Teredinibacter purpureus TaxID=2731756 RepID=UPI0005F88BD0|nr:hypothetical protein [Teredinibacter purpureus]
MKIFSAFLFGLFLSAAATADHNSENTLLSALSTVATYKELRKECSGTVGDERKACFHRLNQLNTDYQAAKELLASNTHHDETNVHLVSYAY